MEQYVAVCRQACRQFIGAYSTSFGLASGLFAPAIRSSIADIYGLVRLADEVVDTYEGPGAAKELTGLEAQVMSALHSGFSTNPVVQAFAVTARQYGISESLIRPFFKSMRLDLTVNQYDQAGYEAYIYGSAEVVGLMCLKVFVADEVAYDRLVPGARALGAAFQKVNFLRDLADDYSRLQRFYFPDSSFAAFDDSTRDLVVADITKDLATARQACRQLPRSSQYAVGLALRYFASLTNRLAETSASVIKKRRVRVSDGNKLRLYGLIRLRQILGLRAI